MKWSCISKRYILKSKWLNVRKDKIKLSDDLMIDDYYVIEKNDVVIVLPILNNKYAILKKEYRYPINKSIIELPGGTFDKTKEDSLIAAKRELLEETGLKSNNWTNFGEFYDYPSKDTHQISLFLANDCYQSEKPQSNIIEDITLIKIQIEELEEYIKKNLIQVTGSITCIYKALLYLKKLT